MLHTEDIDAPPHTSPNHTTSGYTESSMDTVTYKGQVLAKVVKGNVQHRAKALKRITSQLESTIEKLLAIRDGNNPKLALKACELLLAYGLGKPGETGLSLDDGGRHQAALASIEAIDAVLEGSTPPEEAVLEATRLNALSEGLAQEEQADILRRRERGR